MKIQTVRFNNRKKAFEVRMRNRVFVYPYARMESTPKPGDLVREAHIDEELGREGFFYVLDSGREGTIHAEQVLDYNEDSNHLREALLYKLTVEAQRRLANSSLSRREIIRRLETSATQFYRLLDQTNTRKSVGQLLSLLHILDCDVELVVRKREHLAKSVGGKARRGRVVEQGVQPMSPEVVQRKPEVEQLCRKFRVGRLELFGSAAMGRDRAGQSDLDFLVEFEPMATGSFADSYFDLLESLEHLFGRPVDLVVASAIKNPYFRQAIEPTRVLIYAA